MHVSQIRLNNYRNYEDESFLFSPGINVIYGENGQGKTNLLEAVFLLCRGYSHRASSVRELISFGQDRMLAAYEYSSKGISHRLSLKIQGTQKGYKLDGKNLTNYSAVRSHTGSIIFEPDDLKIVKGEPETRRKFINWELSSLNPAYRNLLHQYNRIRSQRNAVLKQARAEKLNLGLLRENLTPWDEQLINYGVSIAELRRDYLRELSKKASVFHQKLTKTGEELSLKYLTNFLSSEGELQDRYRLALDEGLQKDLERGYTRLGPHADDLEILINQHSARNFASQGQQRSAAISLKLSHIDLYKDRLGIEPVVLLDDILSELDEGRQQNLLGCLEDVQTFITCTNPSFASKFQHQINSLQIQKGKVKN